MINLLIMAFKDIKHQALPSTFIYSIVTYQTQDNNFQQQKKLIYNNSFIVKQYDLN